MNHLTITGYDQEGNIVSLDTINPTDIVRTKYVVHRKILLLVVREPSELEDYQQVPVAFDKKTHQPTKFENRKVNKKGYYTHMVTNEDEIRQVYNTLTDTEFKGLEISSEQILKAKERLEELQKEKESQEKQESPKDTPALSVVE